MYVNFSIRNFWWSNNKLKSYFLFHRMLSKHKYFELECVSDNWHIFSIEFKIGIKEDHAGVRAALSMFGVEVYFHVYDIRHWDYKNNCWQVNLAKEMVKNNFDGF